MSWRDFWSHSSAPAILWCLFVCLSFLLLASALAPLLLEQRSERRVLLKHASVIVLFIIFWSCPVLCVVLTRDEPPGLSRLYHKHDIGGLFMNYWPTWFQHRVEVKLHGSDEWRDVSIDHFFARGMFGGLNRFEQYLWYALRDGERDEKIQSMLIGWLAEQISSRPNEFPNVCGLRLLRFSFSPLENSAPRMPYDAETRGREWGNPEILREAELTEGCARG